MSTTWIFHFSYITLSLIWLSIFSRWCIRYTTSIGIVCVHLIIQVYIWLPLPCRLTKCFLSQWMNGKLLCYPCGIQIQGWSVWNVAIVIKIYFTHIYYYSHKMAIITLHAIPFGLRNWLAVEFNKPNSPRFTNCIQILTPVIWHWTWRKHHN